MDLFLGEVVVKHRDKTISVSTWCNNRTRWGSKSQGIYETFMPPVGGTADRPTDVKPGMVYYNKGFQDH